MSTKPSSQVSKPKRTQRRKRGRPEDQGGKSVGADAIVLKVCELLREVPPREVTLLRVAEYANVDRSLIRYYFRNRASLLLAAARHLFAQMRNEFTVADAVSADDPEAQLRALAGALLRFQIKHPYFHRLMIDEVVNSEEPDAQAFFKSFTSGAIAHYRTATRAVTRHTGFSSADGAFLYLALIGMCEFFVTGAPILRVAFGKDYDAEAVNRQYEKFITHYIVDGLHKR